MTKQATESKDTTVKVISIQPSMTPDMHRPYPYFIVAEAESDYAGFVLRQDFWKGDPYALVGFQDRFDVQTVDLHLRDFIADPSKAVGKYPVFTDANTGGFYTYTVAISDVTEFDDPRAHEEIATWQRRDDEQDSAGDTDSGDAAEE